MAPKNVHADHLPRPHHPADVGEPEEAVAGLHVEGVAELLGHLREAAGVRVHRALGPARSCPRCRGSATRVLGVEALGRQVSAARRGTRRHQRSRPGVMAASMPPAARRARRAGRRRRRLHAGVDAEARSASGLMAMCLPRRTEPSAVNRKRQPAVLQARRERLGAEAREHRDHDGADLERRVEDGDQLGDHGHVEADACRRAATPAAAWRRPRGTPRGSSSA